MSTRCYTHHDTLLSLSVGIPLEVVEIAIGSAASEAPLSGLQPIPDNRCRREGDSQKPPRSKSVQGVSLRLRKFTFIPQNAHLGQPHPRLKRRGTSSLYARLCRILRKRSETCGSKIPEKVRS